MKTRIVAASFVFAAVLRRNAAPRTRRRAAATGLLDRRRDDPSGLRPGRRRRHDRRARRQDRVVSPGAAPEPGAPVVDGKGKHVYPSLFPPMTVLGLEEIDAVRATLDKQELGGINPAARADVAINYDSELLPVARSGGVLVAGVTPIGGIIAGTAVATKLDGWTREDATLKAPAAITIYWPDLRINRSPRREPHGQEAGEDARRSPRAPPESLPGRPGVRQGARRRADGGSAAGTTSIPRLEALLPAIDGAIPVIVHAQRLAQIRDAMKWASEEKLRLVIWGGADAWRMADELAKAGVPVILESPLELPVREDDPYDAQFADAGVLDRAGVRVAFNDGGDDASNVRNFPQLAAMAVAYGYPREKALAALTLEPARILGVDGRIGSLEPGKDATLILTDGDILDLRSRVVGAYIDGRALDLTDKQKRLYERYRNRPKPGGQP